MTPKMVTCPHCKDTFEENCEYVHIDMGHCVQVDPNFCGNCGAYELGGLDFDSASEEEQRLGWRRGDRKPPADEKTRELSFFKERSAGPSDFLDRNED